MYQIPFNNIPRQYATLKEELLEAINNVYLTGNVLDGKNVENFEKAVAARCHRRYGVAVNSGSQALAFALALMFDNPSKILIPDVSFIATLNSVLMQGHEPKFCDVDTNGMIDLETLDYALEAAGVNGIMYVNLFGNVVDYDKLRLISRFFNNNNVKVIEDAAQSFGASFKGIPSGSLGDVSILSFDPTKNLPNYGSGGMVLVDNLFQVDILKDFRDNGKMRYHTVPGTNSKMSESDCAQMLVKLRYFDQWQERRAEIAKYYLSELAEFVDVPTVEDNVVHAWHKFVISVDYRHTFKEQLAAKGIETKIHYINPLSNTNVASPFSSGRYRQSVAFCGSCLSLPIYPELTDSEVDQIVASVKAITEHLPQTRNT